MKKTISTLLLVAFLISIVTPDTAYAAVKINKKKATLEVDATLTLKVSGTTDAITWTSSKKSVATVSSKGKVIAKAEGQATISAIIGKVKYTSKITVVNNNKTSFSGALGAGEYEVGVDIPAGKYDLECIVGAGSVLIYNNIKEFEENKYNYSPISMANKDSLDYEMFPNLYTPTYKNLKLSEGNYIIINTAQIDFQSK